MATFSDGGTLARYHRLCECALHRRGIPPPPPTFQENCDQKCLWASLTTLVAKQQSSGVQKGSFEQHEEEALANSD